MRTPQENPSGYDDNSPINFTDKIKGKYLIVHGTADDNVHFQNAAEMANQLIGADMQGYLTQKISPFNTSQQQFGIHWQYLHT